MKETGVYCCDCGEELLAEDNDKSKTLRCPECWAKMEDECDLEEK